MNVGQEQGEGQDSDEEDNPYDHNLDIKVGEHMSHEDLKTTLANLPKTPKAPKASMHPKTLVVDKNVIASRLMHLQKRGVILYTVNFNLSRDHFENWAYMQIGENLNIKIKYIKVITRFTFCHCI